MEKRENKLVGNTDIYQYLKKLSYDEIGKLILQSKTQEEADFYFTISDFFLQQSQKEVIKKGIF